MSDVVIAGIGQTPVGEQWDVSLRSLAAKAIQAARKDAGSLKPQAIYVGNVLASMVSGQSNLGALFADNCALGGIEGISVEASDASGAAAFRMGYMAVASGFVDVALVVGAEKCSDAIGANLEEVVSHGVDADYEALQGLSLTGQAAMLMRRYLHEYDLPQISLGEFPILAHENAVTNPNAMYRRSISYELYERGGMLCEPLNMFDKAAYADGAAAIILTRKSLLPDDFPHPLVRVIGSSVVIDTLALHDRPDPLAFKAAGLSVERACRQAGILPSDVDLFELSDSFSIYASLSLEAAGFAHRGEGWKLARERQLTLEGDLPILTMGGAKARGNPLGATGVYQLVEAILQLRQQAGPNQINGAKKAMVQTLGGPASTAVTHVLEALG